MKSKPKAATSTTAMKKNVESFSAEERAAAKARVQELKSKQDGEGAVRESIAAMQKPDRTMAERIDAIVRASAPILSPKTWYGMPAYAKDGKTICFFQPAAKFKTRYATFGFSDAAKLDEGGMWPNAYALKELTAVEEARIAALVKKASR